MGIDTQETAQQTWTMTFSVNELIALAKACADLYEKLLTLETPSLEDRETFLLLGEITERMPEPDWFPEEVRP